MIPVRGEEAAQACLFPTKFVDEQDFPVVIGKQLLNAVESTVLGDTIGFKLMEKARAVPSSKLTFVPTFIPHYPVFTTDGVVSRFAKADQNSAFTFILLYEDPQQLSGGNGFVIRGARCVGRA